MASVKFIAGGLAVFLLLVSMVSARSGQLEELESILHDPQLAKEISSDVETDLLNYLFAKQIMNRIHEEDRQNLLRKRAYWKQCAVNAVTCFGK